MSRPTSSSSRHSPTHLSPYVSRASPSSSPYMRPISPAHQLPAISTSGASADHANPQTPTRPRRRSWFREEDPDAFSPSSLDPNSLSPMASMRQPSPSTDLARRTSNASTSSRYSHSRGDSQTNFSRPLSSGSGSGAGQSTGQAPSNPFLTVGGVAARRKSEYEYEHGRQRGDSQSSYESQDSTLVSGPRSPKRSMWERVLRRGSAEEAGFGVS